METTNNKAQPAPVIELLVPDNGLTASVRIRESHLPPRQILLQLKEKLKAQHIFYGIQTQALKNILAGQNSDQTLLVARGTPARVGKSPEFKPLIDFNPVLKGKEYPNGHVNHKEILRSNIVEAGAVLGKILPGESSIPGQNIFGKIIPAPPVDLEMPVRLGENVDFASQDPGLIIAREAGLAVISPSGVIDVLTTMTIEGDIDFDTGNIDFPGSVVVAGDVKPGFSVKAGLDANIHGTVGDAEIIAGRDITVDRGFAGNMKGLLRAGRDVKLAFAHNQNIEAAQDILFEIELIGCRAKAGRSISSGNGRIVGGEYEALRKISVHLAGSDEEIITRLAVGQRNDLLEERRRLDQELKNHEKLLADLKKKLYQLVVKKLEAKLDTRRQEQFEKLQAEKEALGREILHIHAELELVDEKLQDVKNAMIRISGVMFPNVEVKIGLRSWTNADKRRFISLRGINDKIQIMRI